MKGRIKDNERYRTVLEQVFQTCTRSATRRYEITMCRMYKAQTLLPWWLTQKQESLPWTSNAQGHP